MDSLIHNHPFGDGNKRTGIAATALFLELNGISLTATNPEVETFTLHVATDKPAVAEIARWLQGHVQAAGHPPET